MNKLEEIMNEISKEMRFCENEMPHTFAQAVAIKFGKHLLEEATENAKIKGEWKTQGGNPKVLGSYRRVFDGYIIDKQSITDTINKYL